MHKFLPIKNPSFIALLLLLLFALSCNNLSENRLPNSASTNRNSENSVKQNSSTNQNSNVSPNQFFSKENICSIPMQIASSTPYANLGGGSWDKWGDSGGELDYGCKGGKDSTK